MKSYGKDINNGFAVLLPPPPCRIKVQVISRIHKFDTFLILDHTKVCIPFKLNRWEVLPLKYKWKDFLERGAFLKFLLRRERFGSVTPEIFVVHNYNDYHD